MNVLIVIYFCCSFSDAPNVDNAVDVKKMLEEFDVNE